MPEAARGEGTPPRGTPAGVPRASQTPAFGALQPPVPPPQPPAAAPPAPSGVARKAEDTIGDLSTVHGSGDELVLSWTEGMLVADRFRIVRCIGQGGMGMVYLAHDQSLDRPIAMKRVPQEILFDGDARDDLRQEANRLLDLAHENIIRVHTYYDEPAWPFFAMEFLQGPTAKELLRHRKQEGRTFTPEEVLVVARQVDRGLSYAHGKGVIHRDLKPGNLMFASAPGAVLTEKDVIKITDFGISRVVADSTMRQTGKRSGTLPYMSPEQFRGEAASIQSDVYSLAATYYELLTGKPPFYTGDIGYQIVHIHPKPLGEVPKPMAEAILRGLHKNPRQRPETVRELTEAMEGNAPSRISLLLRHAGPAIRTASVLAGVILVVAILAFWAKRSWDAKGGPAGGGNGDGTGVASVENVRQESPFPAEASGRIGREIRTQVEEVLRNNEIAKTSFIFGLRPRGELKADILGRVRFELTPGSQGFDGPPRAISGRPAIRDGKADPESLEFVVADLYDGQFTLKALLAGDAIASIPIRVDTVGPEVQVGPVNSDALIEIKPGRFVTYNGEADLQLDTPKNPQDIAEAFYQVADPQGQYGEMKKVPSTALWKIDLVPGKNGYRVTAADSLGNKTETTFTIHRLNLEVVTFEIDQFAGGVQGNTVPVRGMLNMEKYTLESGSERSGGDGRMRPPTLCYMVGEQMMTPREATDATPDNLWFKALLVLPRAKDTIEVRYKWGDKIPRPFPQPSVTRITDIVVPSPKIELNPLPRETNKNSIELIGKVTPYFDGLAVHLVFEPVGSERLRLVPAEDGAVFSSTKFLNENTLHRFTFTCYYQGEALPPSLPATVAQVYFDYNLPTVLDVEFKPMGMNIEMVITPSEPLSNLEIQFPAGSPPRQVPVRPDATYIVQVPAPSKKQDLLIHMFDLAGNENTVRESCPLFDPGIAPKEDVVSGVSGNGQEGTKTAVTPRPSPRLVKQTEFLKELSLDFAPYGIFGQEMSIYEVNQKAWNTFQREILGRRDVPPGSTAIPMTLDERFDSELLNKFAKWIGQKSNDGYRYSIPTDKNWMTAFAGSKDPRDAPDVIVKWFKGTLGGIAFNPSPGKRYADPDVLPCGSRQENRTPTGLLDMESNIQEIVRDENGLWYVIGGHNRDRVEDLESRCTAARPYLYGTSLWAYKYTGFRLCREPID
jgi:hypothetical protein